MTEFFFELLHDEMTFKSIAMQFTKLITSFHFLLQFKIIIWCTCHHVYYREICIVLPSFTLKLQRVDRECKNYPEITMKCDTKGRF